ncbi:hypothetical protein [Bacteroides sp. 224]|uniref:hypothetical protein n=1 Tax=Bacteroides sp. 224 TaxID=2302936 RepID=UPI0013CF6B49|nr:hypothetical protein [Bacteroides sp. 224]NDV66541.1 hypothetical protein [Bacteroides sp. 224]
MKKTFSHIKATTVILIILFASIILLLHFQHKEVVANIFSKTPQILKESVKQYASSTTKDQLRIIRYDYQPKKHKIGEYVTKRYQTADTLIIYQAKVVDYETHIFNSNQTDLSAKNELHPQPIQHLFDSLLKENNIYHTQTAIEVTHSVLSKFHEWSRDTTSMSIDQQISFTNQGNFEDIHYYAYIDYSFLTFWKIMPKGVLSILIAISIIIIIAIGVFHLQNHTKADPLPLLVESQHHSKDFWVDTLNKKLIYKEGEKKKGKKLTSQIEKLSKLFLESENNRVNKNTLKKKLWPNHIDATTNMTTAIKRFKDFLYQIKCGYTVISDPENEDYYLFTLSDPSPETDDQNENETIG